MKLVIFIPCYNEEETLPLVLESLPSHIKGIDEIQTIVIDDGSSDKTSKVAKDYGIKEIVRHRRNQGLARSFRHGLQRSLELGADVIVITEGDNQYKQERIPDLIKPIMDGTADVVISDRMTQSISHFSPTKKLLQQLGTGVLNLAADTSVPDVMSGFRAYSRKAAMQLNPIADHSWATETTMQASQKGHRIVSVPIPTNPQLRESRQFKSIWTPVRRGGKTISRGFVMYKPYAVFLSLGALLLALGLIPFAKFAYDYFTERTSIVFGPHHLQGLIIGSVLLVGSFISFTLGVIADLIRINRLLIEQVLEEAKLNRMGR
jgi:glycosyltransferase involved in cell wall biosynthesis